MHASMHACLDLSYLVARLALYAWHAPRLRIHPERIPSRNRSWFLSQKNYLLTLQFETLFCRELPGSPCPCKTPLLDCRPKGILLRPPGPPQQNPTCARGEHSPLLPAGPARPSNPAPTGKHSPLPPPGVLKEEHSSPRSLVSTSQVY